MGMYDMIYMMAFILVTLLAIQMIVVLWVSAIHLLNSGLRF